MSKYRKKPVIVEAIQWFSLYDHPDVKERGPVYFAALLCPLCSYSSNSHGIIKTLEGEHIVCPGDWIITGVEGEHYACKPSIFAKTYEKV